MDSPPQSPPLPVRAILVSAVFTTLRNSGQILRLCWPYLLLLLVSLFFIDEDSPWTVQLTLSALTVFTMILALVGLHRIFLLPEDRVRATPTFRWRFRETSFLLKLLGIYLLLLIVYVLPTAVVAIALVTASDFTEPNSLLLETVEILFGLPAAYLVGRWSLVLPDAAVGNNHGIQWAWDVSRGHGLQLWLLVGLLPLGSGLLLDLLGLALGSAWPVLLLEAGLWSLVAAMEVCILSLCYRQLVPDWSRAARRRLEWRQL